MVPMLHTLPRFRASAVAGLPAPLRGALWMCAAATAFALMITLVRQLTDGRGVETVLDGVGAASWGASLASVARRGMLVTFGNASGPVPPFTALDLVKAGSIYVTRPSISESGRLEIDVTIDDPKAYTRPWTVRVNQRLLVDGTDLIEFVCLENQKFNGAALK